MDFRLINIPKNPNNLPTGFLKLSYKLPILNTTIYSQYYMACILYKYTRSIDDCAVKQTRRLYPWTSGRSPKKIGPLQARSSTGWTE